MAIKNILKNTARHFKEIIEQHKQRRRYRAERIIAQFDKPWFQYFPASELYMKATRAYFTWGLTLSKIGMIALMLSLFKSIAVMFVAGIGIMTFMMAWTVVMLLWEQSLKAMNRKRERHVDINYKYHAATGDMDTHSTAVSHSGLSLSMSEKEGLHIEDVVADIFGINTDKNKQQKTEKEIEK